MVDDTLLLEAIRASGTEGLAILFEAYADRIYRLSLQLLGDPQEAEDIVQETFLKAYAHLDGFQGRSGLGTWLYRIAYNGCMERLRRRREHPLPGGEDLDEEPGGLPQVFIEWQTPEDILLSDEGMAALDAAIGALPETLRLVFVLRDVEGLNTAQTAEVVGISQAAAKVRLHRARLALRETLADSFARQEVS